MNLVPLHKVQSPSARSIVRQEIHKTCLVEATSDLRAGQYLAQSQRIRIAIQRGWSLRLGDTSNRLDKMQTPPWVEYRRKQYKPRATIAITTILFESFKQVLKEYTKNSSLAGMNQMTDPNIGWKSRYLRIMVFAATFSIVCYFLIYTWVTTLSNPLILMPQYSTYSIADIDYPAIAFCNVNRISMKAVKRQALDLYNKKMFGNVTLNHVEEFLISNGRLLDFTDLVKLSDFFSEIDLLSQNKKHFDSHIVKNAMKELAPDCNEMLLRCSWAGLIVNCSELFQMRRTARGHCCAFNYVLDYDSEGHPNKSLQARRQTRPGYLHGLNVILDPLLDDYAYPLNMFWGFDLLVFEPTHFADPSAGRVLHRLVEPNRLEYLELKSIKQTATREVRKYSLSTRKCIFQDEKKAEYHDLYSYSACIIRCKIQFLLSVCQCAPYFLPMGKSEGPVCLLSDLMCLNNYKDKLSHLQPTGAHDGDYLAHSSLHCPDCYPDCEHTRHVTRSYKTSTDTLSVKKYYSARFIDGINLTDKCIVSIYFASPEGELERLDVVSYWYQVISSIGGFAGMLIGFSVFTVVEIVYFLFLRFSQVFIKNYSDFH